MLDSWHSLSYRVGEKGNIENQTKLQRSGAERSIIIMSNNEFDNVTGEMGSRW